MTDLVTRGARNCASAYHAWGVRTGHAVAEWPDAAASDLGLAGSGPIDSACLLAAPPEGDALDDLVDRVEAFFGARPGGPLQIWSAWPTPDLTGRGYVRYDVPAMLREAGTEAAAPPPELQVSGARSPADLQDVAALLDDVFECRAPDVSRLVTASLVGEDCEVFLGRVEGLAVATSMAFVSDGLCGVYAVATAAHARGRGYGEAITWAATMFRPDLPAALQASPMGFPVYQRMGYRRYGTFQLWQGRRPGVHP